MGRSLFNPLARFGAVIWAEQVNLIAAWAGGEPMDDGEFTSDVRAPDRPRDVFLFFDNTDGFRAPDDALAMMRELDVEWRPTDDRLLI